MSFDQRLHAFVPKDQCLQHDIFADLIGATLDHQDGIFGAGDPQVKLGGHSPIKHVDPDAKAFSKAFIDVSKAVSPTVVAITVTTMARQRDEQSWITITVQDTGPGIAPHDRAHIFERFYRGEIGRKSGAPGTGLGLAISYDIVQHHHGRIEVESEQGRGTTFRIWLPTKGS